MSTKRLRFTSDDDLCLLREVVGQNPLQCPEKWNIIQANIKSITGKEFVIRTLKDHLMLLLTMWKKKSEVDKYRSGTEEVYSEKDTLMQEISDMCTEFPETAVKKTKVVSKEKQIAEMGRQSREQNAVDATYIVENNDHNQPIEEIVVMDEHNYFDPTNINLASTPIHTPEPALVDPVFVEETTVHNRTVSSYVEPARTNVVATITNAPKGKKSTVPGPMRNRQNKSVLLRKNAMEYLNKKNEKELEIKIKELYLEEQKLKLEARKLEIEEKRLEMELEDRKKKSEFEYEKLKSDIKQRIELQSQITSQQKLIETLLKRLDKYEE